MASAALASLNEAYTDSEGEERGSDADSVTDELHPTLAERFGDMGKDSGTQSGTPGSSTSAKSGGTPTSNSLVISSNSAGGTPSKKAKLVSYHDPDAGLSDDETEPVPMVLESDDDDKENDAVVEQENGTFMNVDDDEKEKSHLMEELWEGGVKLPPEPTGQCSRELQVNIIFYIFERFSKINFRAGCSVNPHPVVQPTTVKAGKAASCVGWDNSHKNILYRSSLDHQPTDLS